MSQFFVKKKIKNTYILESIITYLVRPKNHQINPFNRKNQLITDLNI